MGHESPITKAAREFTMADPENCDKEWAAYLALVNVRESASASSPTNSSSPLHHHTPAAAVTAPSTTRSTATLRVLSSAVSTDDFTVDDLSPAARRFYDFLGSGSSSPTTAAPLPVPSSGVRTGNLHEPPSATSTATRAIEILRTMATAKPAASSALTVASTCAPSSANYTGGIPGLGAATAAAEKDLRSVTTTRVESASRDITALATTVPTNCSSECPSHDAVVPEAVIISSATPSSPTTNCGTVSKLAEPADSDKALEIDTMGDTSVTAAICLQGDLEDCNEDSMDMSLTPGSAPAPFVAPQVFAAMVLRRCVIKNSVEDTCVLMPKFNSPVGFLFTTVQGYSIHYDCTLLPWPYFKCNSFWTLLSRQVLSEQREGFSFVVALHIQHHPRRWPYVQFSAFQFCLAGRASLPRYGAVQFLWEISWPKTTTSYSIPNGLQPIIWEIAWTLRYEWDFLVPTYRLQINILQNCFMAWVEHLSKLSELGCCCEYWTSWQLHFLIPVFGIQPGTPIFQGNVSCWFQLSVAAYIEIRHGLLLCTWSLAVTIYFTALLTPFSRDIIRQLSCYFTQFQDFLIAIAKLQPRPILEVPHYMCTCFSLWSPQCHWFVGSGIQFCTPVFLLAVVRLGMCMVLTTGNLPSSLCQHAVVIFLYIACVLRYLSKMDSVEEPKPPWLHLVSTSSTLGNAKQFLSADTCSSNWQHSTNLPNPPYWNGSSFPSLLICWVIVLFMQWFSVLLVVMQGYISLCTVEKRSTNAAAGPSKGHLASKGSASASWSKVCQHCCISYENLYNCQHFQWAIAWFVNYQISLYSFRIRLSGVIWNSSNDGYHEKWFKFLLWLHGKDLSFRDYSSMDQMMLITGHTNQCGMKLQIGHPYCIDIFFEQALVIHYLNLVKVIFDYDNHRDIIEFLKHRVH